MQLIIYLFLVLFLYPVEVFSSEDIIIDNILKVARKSFSDQENVRTLKHLVYEQNYSDSKSENSGKRRQDNFFNYLVDLYSKFPLIRIGYNNPCEFNIKKGYVTVCFFIQQDYHHAGLVFEYPGFWKGTINAALCHLAYGEESGSGEKRKKVYRIFHEGKKEIINKLVWARNNKSGNENKPDRGILRWYPYCTFEVDLDQMYKSLKKISWNSLLKREYSYDYMGLIHHNCCTYVAEQLEEMEINLKYKKSYSLYFTDKDLKRLIDFYCEGKYEINHKYTVKYAEYEDKNTDVLPLAISNRTNLYRVLKAHADMEAEKEDKEKVRKKLKDKKNEEKEKKKARNKLNDDLKDFYWKGMDCLSEFITYIKMVSFFTYWIVVGKLLSLF